MKTKFILSLALLCAVQTMAQKTKDVPATMMASFTKQYTDATQVKWDKENGKYEASFHKGGKHMSVTYNTDGSVDETETGISIDKLPAEAKKYAEAKGKIKEAAIIVKPDGTQTYEANVNGRDLIFDKAGTFIKEMKD